jgi:hypothetical protein
MNTVEFYYSVITALSNKLPNELIKYVFGFDILTDGQRLRFITDRLRAYDITGNKRTFGKFIRTVFYGHRLRNYGLTYLVKSPHGTRIYYGQVQRIDGKFNRIQDIITRLCDAGSIDLLDGLIVIEKYLLENKFIR